MQNLVNNLISIGAGREAAFAAAVLGDNALMEKAWQDTGMLAEAVLHAHAHGRPTLKNLVQAWNKMLQKDVEHTPLEKTDAVAAFLASLEEPKLTSLADAAKKPPTEILPPGMPSLTVAMAVQKKPPPGAQNSQQQPGKPLLLEAAPATTPPLQVCHNNLNQVNQLQTIIPLFHQQTVIQLQLLLEKVSRKILRMMWHHQTRHQMRHLKPHNLMPHPKAHNLMQPHPKRHNLMSHPKRRNLMPHPKRRNLIPHPRHRN
ncbi:cyclic AMP-responsive element-binding protein 5-like [Rosa chinensis]|uniref:cyclic AMP-responsive element-binding protein 5-like n=1 Tax=Rosa chinensis TaxID=74649 RepID=UPI001AD8E21B|nr:cyclic AMP-responsive element-binding protein 5-like [Rosa chinensis]